MDFSLIFATRSRIDLLEGLFKSLAATTTVPSLVEVMPIIDDDDFQTHESVGKLTRMLPNFRVSFKSRPRSKMLNEDYINWGARHSNGKYIFILNDDVIFKIPNWDRLSFEKLNSYLADKPDGVVYGLTDDGMDQLRVEQKLQYTGFPIISRESLEALGYAMHPSFSSWGADIDLFSVYEGVDRICDLKSEVLAFHLSPHTNTRETDEINKHVAHISPERKGKSSISEDINKIKSYIYRKNPTGLVATEKENSIVTKPNKPKSDKNQKNQIVSSNNLVIERYLQRISFLKRKK